MFYVGIDNGVSGTVGVLGPDTVVFFKTPIIKDTHYAKSREKMTRVDRKKLRQRLEGYLPAVALIEAPFTNPRMFQASVSNHRSHAEICSVLEDLGIVFETVTPHNWQKELLPGVDGREWLKEASAAKARELYPDLKFRCPDADGLLIAEYLRRNAAEHRWSKICEKEHLPPQ